MERVMKRNVKEGELGFLLSLLQKPKCRLTSPSKLFILLLSRLALKVFVRKLRVRNGCISTQMSSIRLPQINPIGLECL
jgi:hypothetical protein